MMKRTITRGEFLRTTALGGLAWAAGSATAQQASAEGNPPNLVVILSDDHCFRAVGYNNPVVRTPNLDRLGHEGVIFDRAYIATPICAASRASLLTGLFPQQHGTIALDGSGFRENVVEQRRMPTVALSINKAVRRKGRPRQRA